MTNAIRPAPVFAQENPARTMLWSRGSQQTGDRLMKLPTCAGLLIAGAAFVSAPAAVAAPLAGPLSLGQANTAATEQVQYRRYHRVYRRHRGYGAYAYARGFGRRGCATGDDSTTSANPSWAVCHG